MPTAPIRDGLSLSFDLHGKGDAKTLLLITGLGGLKEGWFRQWPHFAADYQVLVYDHRGLGGSTLLDQPMTMRDLAEDAVLLLDLLAIDHAHVWGVSMGGAVAMELALGWPDRVDRLILENTHAGKGHKVEGEGASPLRTAGATAEAWLEDVVPMLFGREYREKNARLMASFAKSRERHPSDPRATRLQWEAYEAFDVWDRLDAIPHKTLVLVGDEDALTSPLNGERLADRIVGAELIEVEGAGHSLHIEKPEETNRVVAEFLG